MGESDAEGMEQLPLAMTERLDNGRVAGGDAQTRLTRRVTVFRIAHDRVADVGQVDADLVRTTGFEAALHAGEAGRPRHHAPMRDGSPSVTGLNAHAGAVVQGACDGRVHDPFGLVRASHDQVR